MGQIDTDKKLELVRAIRLSQLNNRAVLNNREQLLYGRSKSPVTRGELHSLEAAALDGAIPQGQEDGGNIFRSFKIRLIIAVMLFAVFAFWDRTEQNIFGITGEKIYAAINNQHDAVAEFINNLLNRDDARES